MTTQVSAVRLTASGSVLGQAGRVRGIWFAGAAGAGTITLKDGGSSGTTVAVFDTPASAGFSGYIPCEGLGLKFNTNIYCAISSVTGVTVMIG